MEQIDMDKLIQDIRQAIKKKTPEEIKDLMENFSLLGFWSELTADIQNWILEVFQQQNLEEKDGYKKGMIVPKPTDPEKLKKREELSKRLKEYPNEDLKKALEWIQAKKEQEKREQEERDRKEEEERKAREVPQQIKNFRKKWEEEIEFLDDETKNKIIEATNRIAPKIKIEPDWSRMIEMTIRWREYKILDVNMKTHTDDEYRMSWPYSWTNRDEVMLWWMRWDNVDNWKNQKLKEYVKEKQREKFHILKIEEMWSFLDELWKEAGITGREYQIAMLMYLTGMYGRYWLSMWDRNKSDPQVNSRSAMECREYHGDFFKFALSNDNASLCLFACEKV